jgi:hypothetical protein
MLAAVVETWVLWLFIVGAAVGAVVALVVAVRLPREEDDVSHLERPAEAAWISSVIEHHGGIAPASLVEEVLDLHQAYLRDPRLARPPVPAIGASLAEPTWNGQAAVPGYPPAAVPGYPPAAVPDYTPNVLPGYTPAQVPRDRAAPEPGFVRAPAPGYPAADGPSGPGVGPAGVGPAGVGPAGVGPAGKVLDRPAK